MNMIPRAEHPRPDLYGREWVNLNGEWEFEIDDERVGLERRYYERDSLAGRITVPFSPESELSGVNHKDFMHAVWYRRGIELPESFEGKRVILHIGACDYAATVFVNGTKVGTHRGGYISFSFDITDYLKDSGNYVTVLAEDDHCARRQMSGKQSRKPESYGCYYTRTTGIWQTVWLEAAEAAHVVSYRAYPDITTPSVTLAVKMTDASLGARLTVSASYGGKVVGEGSVTVSSLCPTITLPLSEKHLWEVGKGRLYDLTFSVEKNGAVDELRGYFGLREVSLTKEGGLKINGKTVFGRFVLDQGFYPDGIITAPTEEALVYDIETSMACGFNGARLHQKVFEPLFLYHADRLGYMVWGETPNWGLDHTDFTNLTNVLPEWLEEVERDFSHPAVIGWCPFNETWDIDGRTHSVELIDMVYLATKSADTTRPVIANSGSMPTNYTDAHDVHDYEQDVEKFRSYYSKMDQGIIEDQLYRKNPEKQVYKTYLPVFVSEYGGIKWTDEGGNAWGYGKSVQNEQEFFDRLEGLTDVLLENPRVFGFCYTQLTDVEQEQNGVLTYGRKPKFAPERFAKIFGKKAVIEE